MSLNSECKNIVGNEWVTDDIQILNHYSHDQSFVPPSQPELVTFPKSVEEVEGIVKLANSCLLYTSDAADDPTLV